MNPLAIPGVDTVLEQPVVRALLGSVPREVVVQCIREALDELRERYEVVSPDPGYARVGAPSLAMHAETRIALAQRDNEFVCSGWVDYRPAEVPVPDAPPPDP